MPGTARRAAGRTAAPTKGAALASRVRLGSPTDLVDALSAITTLPRAALIDRWKAAYGRSPPKGISRSLLEHAAAHDLQVRAQGGLKPATRRALMAVPDQNPGKPVPPTSPRRLVPGARLVRQWRGRTHSVEVLDQGFLWSGRRYGSLSAIARAITGTNWSGPRFFGL